MKRIAAVVAGAADVRVVSDLSTGSTSGASVDIRRGSAKSGR